jgi:hypothetical protein
MATNLIINVPKTDRAAFNPKRPAGKLLQAQTLHLREALIKHLHQVSSVLAIDPTTLKTEGDISDYIGKATAILHPQGEKKIHQPRNVARPA